jgi:beta-lactamase superfamily II metal-dependent hydrolase
MSVQIEFLAVGDESKGGDAIIVCIGPPDGPRHEQTIIVVDGGYKANGDQIVEMINKWYDTNLVDIVVSTHPDQDHISGLFPVLERMVVRQLLMHLPWKHSTELAALRPNAFKSARLSDYVEKSLSEASSLDELATQLGIPIIEPFTGVSTRNATFRVLGPDRDFYTEQLALVPDATTTSGRLTKALADLAHKAVHFIEDLFTDNLSDDETTSPRNNTSVISLISDPESDTQILLTADAGIAALERVVPGLRALGIGPGELDLIQVPHHGSRHNVGPMLLNELLGAPGVDGGRGQAVASVPAKNPHGRHPSKRVTNAFRRRGYPVAITQGEGPVNVYLSQPPVDRPGYSPMEPLPFFSDFEDHE